MKNDESAKRHGGARPGSGRKRGEGNGGRPSRVPCPSRIDPRIVALLTAGGANAGDTIEAWADQVVPGWRESADS